MNSKTELDPAHEGATTQGRRPAESTPLDLKAALIGAVIALLVMAPVAYKMMADVQQRIDHLEAHSSSPVAVIDFTNMVAQSVQVGSSNEELERTVRAVDAAVRKLTDAGYLVLDSKAVLSAPPALYVSESMILGMHEDHGQSSGAAAATQDSSAAATETVTPQ